MGIFTGTEILFFGLGALSVLLAGGLVVMKKQLDLNWQAMALGLTGACLILFCIAWSVSSVLEGETQAANMGLLVFGSPVLIIFGMLNRMVKKGQKK
jgi:hypothetical protein